MAEIKFNKSQLRSSERFAPYKDIISAFFEEDKSYSIEEAEKIINNFLRKGEK